MLATVERVMLRNLESTTSDETLKVRRREIDATHGTKRAVLRASHGFTERYPGCVAKMLGVEYVPVQSGQPAQDLEYLAEGYEAVVFKHGGRVIKVHKGTAFVSDEKRQERAARKSREHEAMAAMLGQVTLPQQIDIGGHPTIGRLTVVRTMQEYCGGLTDPQLAGQSGCGPPTPEGLEEFGINHPQAFAQLPAFIEGAFALYDAHRLVPDMEGPRNLMLRPAYRRR